jgi:flavin-dependent dehydrogenase
VDPILSGGVDFAIRGGLDAALAILDGTPAAAVAYEEELRRQYRAYLRLARYWYGNNRSVAGLFWEAHEEIPPTATSVPKRAFVYLTTGRYAADTHVRVFQEWQEKKMFRALGVDPNALRRALGTGR